MSYRFQALNPMLHTLDMEKTIAWYTSVLGFRCSAQADDWCRLQRDEVALMFMCNAHFGSPGVTATQYIYVDDVRGLWAAVKDRVTPEWGPKEMPYGLFEFAIRDPNGYLLSFGQTVGPASEHGS